MGDPVVDRIVEKTYGASEKRDPLDPTLRPLDRHWCQVVTVLWDGATHINPGGFETALLNAIERADTDNRARLALGFPEAVEVANTWNHIHGGSKRVRATAERPYDPEIDR